MSDDRVVLEVFLLTLTLPRDYPERVHRALNRRSFVDRLQKVITTLIREFPSLASVEVSVSR